MSILENVVRIFAPHVCIGCGAEEDRLLCIGCVQSMPTVPSRCYRCKAVTEDYRVCAGCRASTPLHQVMVYTHHRDLAKELIHSMKYERAQAGMREAAVLLEGLAPYAPTDALLAHVPTASGRVRQRGYDHAQLLARALSRGTSLPVATLLRRVGQAHQVGASRAERVRQLEGAFRPLHPGIIRGRHIVLVDDVLTTGATLETAARVLKRAGAKTVSALVFAQA